MTTKKRKILYGKKSLEKKIGPMTFGSFLIAWRKSLELTQSEFAGMIGISAGNLCDIEKGRQLVSARKASQIADIIGYSKTVLIELAINEHLAADGIKMRVKAEVA